jgi:hypothetical protein
MYRSKIQRLVEYAFFGRTVSQKAHGHCLTTVKLCRQRRPGRDGNGGADNRHGAIEPVFAIV